MNLFNNNLFNIENVNLFKTQKQQTVNQEEDIMELTYEIQAEQCFDKDNLPILNPDCFDKDKYQKILDDIRTTLGLFHNVFYVNRVTITNTGNKDINFDDFYKNDRLCFDTQRSIIAIIVNKNTKKYINTEIIYDEKDVFIKFGTIEPKDSIILDLISLNDLCFINLHGKTKFFDEPMKKNKYDYENNSKKRELEFARKVNISKIIMSFLIIVYIFLSLFTLYLDKNNKSLFIRNPFVIKEVVNGNK